jgi:hypothetical protein
MNLPSPFVFSSFFTAGEDRRQGSPINSLRSALTAVLASRPIPNMKTKGDCEWRPIEARSLFESVYDVLGTFCIVCARS